MNGWRVNTGGGGGVDGLLRDDGEGRRNVDVVWPRTDDDDDDAPSAVTASDNHPSSSMNNDGKDLQCRHESVWLEYLYSWNPLAAGNATRQMTDLQRLINGIVFIQAF